MVFIGSVLSHRANKQFAHYTAAKHGVLGLMRAFALELAPHWSASIRSTRRSSCTDMVMNQAYLDRLVGHAGATLEEAKRHYLQLEHAAHPVDRAGRRGQRRAVPASDEARYITGVALPVDLGAMLK